MLGKHANSQNLDRYPIGNRKLKNYAEKRLKMAWYNPTAKFGYFEGWKCDAKRQGVIDLRK